MSDDKVKTQLPPQEVYLDDGAYAKFHGHDIEIWCDRDGVRHHVHLEPYGLLRLFQYAKQCGIEIKC